MEQVAWVTGGAQKLHTSKRHLVRDGALDLRGSVPRVTLCGRRFKMSLIVPPNDYWTDDDCQRCRSIAARWEAA